MIFDAGRLCKVRCMFQNKTAPCTETARPTCHVIKSVAPHRKGKAKGKGAKVKRTRGYISPFPLVLATALSIQSIIARRLKHIEGMNLRGEVNYFTPHLLINS